MSCQINILLDPEERRHITSAARAAGLTQREYCRRTLLAAASEIDGPAGRSLLDLMREVHARVCGKPSGGTEADAAAEALVQMGIPAEAARFRAAGIVAENPQANAAEIIREALR